MSIRVIAAVHRSRLEPKLRHLAATLAFFADDDGGEVRPGVAMLMRAMGAARSTIIHGLTALQRRGVLQRDGAHHRTRRYRFVLDRLSSYVPTPARRDRSRQRDQSEASIGAASGTYQATERCRQRHGKVPPAASKGAASGIERCRQRHALLDLNDPQDPHDPHDLTGADAPAPLWKTPETDGADAPTNTDQADGADPFKRYVAIAQQAFSESMLERNDSAAGIAEHAKRLCRQQGITYDADSLARAIEAVRADRDKARDSFWDQKRATPKRRMRETP